MFDPAVTDVAVQPGNEDSEGETTQAPLLPAPGEAAAAEDSDVLLVAGLPLPDWTGPTSAWPLDTPLSSFFSEASDPFSASFSGSREARRGAAPPQQAQREAFERMEVFSGEMRRQLRFAASTGATAELLRGLFAHAAESAPDEPPSLVARDRFDDRYLVAVPVERCGRSGRRGGCSGAGAFEPEHLP